MKKLLTLLLLFPLLSLAQGDQTIINPTIGGGATQKALLHLPNDYNSTSIVYPLLVFVHGAGEAGTNPASIYNSPTSGGPAYVIAQGQWPTSFINPDDGLPYKYIVLSPQYLSSANPTTGPQLDSIIDYMIAHYRVDTTRIYVTCISAGGTALTEDIGDLRSNGAVFNRMHQPAAAVPMSAVMDANRRPAWGVNIVRDVIGVWGFGSLTDTHGANTSGLVYIINDKGGKNFTPPLARFTSYTGGHCCWVNLYTPNYKETINGKTMNIYEWMLTYTQHGSTPPPPPLPPVVSTFTPTSAATGATVTITGTDFSGVTAVTFGGTPAASYTVNSTTSISAVVGAGTSGSIAVTTGSGTGSRAGFTYVAPSVPTITSFSPTTGTAGTTVTITGTNFSSVSAVKFGGTTASSFTVNSSTSITAVVGAGSSGSVSVTTTGGTGSKAGFTFSTPPAPVDVHKIVYDVQSEYKHSVITADSNWWAPYFNNTLHRTVMSKYQVGTRKIIKGYGGLYNAIAIDDQGYVWMSNNNDSVPARVDVDTLGAAFSGITDVTAFNFEYFAIRPTGKIWVWGLNTHLLNGSNVNTTWTKPNLVPGQPEGVVFTKVRTSQNELVALSSDGDIYEWQKGASAPVKRTLPGVVTDFDAGYFDVYVALINGHPWGWSRPPAETGIYLGIPGTISTPVDLSSTWGINQNVIDVALHQNVTHFLLADSTLWGMGDQSQGEVGNGIEFVNKFEYPTQFVWDWTRQKNMITTPVQIAIGKKFKKLFSSQSSVVYNAALGADDSLYIWGRSKSKNLLGASVKPQTVAPWANNDNVVPNCCDVTVPTPVDPFKTVGDGRDFVSGQAHAGADQNVVGNTCTLTGSATPSTFFATTGYRWINLSGGNAVITSPNEATTAVTGLDQGTYVFQLIVQDENFATYADTVRVTVTSTPNISPTVTLPADTTITLPADTITLTGSAIDPDGSVVSYLWTKTSGPSCSFVTPTSATTKIRGLQVGTYVFRLAATDNDGGTGFADITVTVRPANPTTTIEVRIRKGTNVLIISDN